MKLQSFETKQPTNTSHVLPIVRLSIPLIVGQLGIIVQQFADTAMVGRYGTPDLSAAGFVGTVFAFVTFFLLGVSYSTTPVAGVYYSNGDREGVARTLRESLLVNLLDNAIEASRRASSPSISVKLCMKQDYLFCYVTNNIDEGSLSANPELKSTKKDKTMHGFGIRTVKLIAEQYHGDCEFSVKDGRFFATVMLACGTAEPSRRGA